MMRKLINARFAMLTVLLVSGVAVQAQVYDFEDYTIGDTFDVIGWNSTDLEAVVADDPLSSGNNVLKCTVHNYNAAPVLEFTLPAGKTLADYPTFTFKAYFAQGDVGWKDIVVEAYQTKPTAQAFNNAAVKIGSWNRAAGGSTAWEDITINIAGSASLTETIYIAFGIHCAGTGNIGGTGVTTIWYADDVDLGIEEPSAEGFVTQWGSSGYDAWPILNDATTPDGDAGMGDGSPTTGWSSLRGAFPNTLTATTTQAVVVTGQVEFVGGGGDDAYTHFRYSLTYQDSVELKYQYTDSAAWVAVDTGVTTNHDGYLLCPRSGLGTMANTYTTGAQGTFWTVPGANWVSTNNAGAEALAAIKQAPRNAEMIAGVYDFAFSVQDMGDGTNEVRWYIVEVNNKYWFGGTVIDTTQISDKFNGIIFGVNKDNDATQFNVYEVKASMGNPITVPEAPWEPFYVNEWGSSGYDAWPILNDSTYFDGDAAMGDGSPTTGWSSIKGGFGDPVSLPDGKALIVTGQVEFVGGGGESEYTHFRYSLTYQENVELKYQYTDSAAWVAVDTAVTTNHDGYLLCPRSGLGTMANTYTTGAQGTFWTVPGANWVSTNNAGAEALAAIKQAPRNAEMIAGVYDFAFSVQDMGDGTNEVRWYIVEVNNKYWFGGTVIDTTQISDKFNSIIFGVNKDNDATQFNVYEVQVDIGDPITVPEAPWEPFYVSEWGSSGYDAWPILNDSTYFDGDAAMGDGSPTTGWSSIKGGFGDPVSLPDGKALIVTGQVEFVGGGGGSAYTHFRYSLTYQENVELKYQYTDSAAWVAVDTAVTTNHDGYLLCPRSGLGTMANTYTTGAQGTFWTVPGANWVSTNNAGAKALAAIKQAPRNAEMIASVYDFAFSVQDMGDGTNEVRWYIVEENNKYWFGGTVIDTDQISDKFNSIIFGVNKDNDATQFNVYEVQVDIGKPIEVPEAPWEAYYVSDWGFSGGNLGSWELTPGEFDGDVTIGGTAAPTGWSAVRGGFEPYMLTTTEDRALIITGQIELVGGGFEDVGSLRYGVFYSDSAGTLTQDASLDSNWVWDGTDRAHYGYLFVPPSGSNIASWSGVSGTWGAIANEKWWDIDGSNNFSLDTPLQTPANAVAGSGTYDFAISVSAKSMGNLVEATLSKTDGSYYYEAYTTIPLVATTNKFNCVAFAINNSETLEMNLIEIQVDRGRLIITDIPGEEVKQLPTVFSLSQNYPNPFNPTTTIEFALPQRSDVSLIVYDVQGRAVAELVNDRRDAGHYTVHFDASSLSSGVYFYKLKAGDKISVKKLVLVK